ncbi:hypothetical protein [Ureibacillus sinduriensis]|uniref:Uncharacterized protein n=2 Tax=Ureibacillus sinduriensis TaxID=561440 RepID=A0A0A3I1C7_9BACL|nr:hypothetical protein [Ureibacillus sinduriensis]KGR76453.1 hypothetical protein CD33_06170 [Ureibacillus sinduriensis BLB-1 = JCM 15800]
MFNTMKFFQTIGVSILLTIVISFLLGFLPIESYGLFLFVQIVLTYGCVGFFAAIWNTETPYTAAYLGSIVIVFINLLVSHFVFNILVFADPEGIGMSLSSAVIVSLLFAVVTVFIRNKREGVL